MKKIFVLFIIVTTALVLAVDASADKVKPDLMISPSPTHVGDLLVFSGCGYGRPKDVSVKIYAPDGSEQYGFATNVDQTGCFNFASDYSPPFEGTYEAYVFPDKSAGDGPGTYNYNHPSVDYDFQVLP